MPHDQPAAVRPPPTARSATAKPAGIRTTAVLGVDISAVDVASATTEMLRWMDAGERRYVTVTGVHGVIEAQDDPGFKRILNGAGLTVADGRPMFWLSRLAGRRETGHVSGFELTLAVSEALSKRKGRAFYYGAGPGIAEALGAVLSQRFPGLETAGAICPPFRELTAAEEDRIVAEINAARPDVVWVGLSTPKQERWMARFRDRLDAPALAGIGAAFDFLTGRVKLCPRWIRKLGFEWLYRIFQEPRRLWKRYARNNPLFVYYLICEKLRLKRFVER